MKSFNLVRFAVAPILITSLLQSELAFAALKTAQAASNLGQTPSSGVLPGRLPLPGTAKQAIAVVRMADLRPLSNYFATDTSSLTLVQLKTFDDDFATLAKANELIKYVDSAGEFNKWWLINQTSILTSRSQMVGPRATLQSFFAQVYLQYKLQESQSQKDPNKLISWMYGQIHNPLIMSCSLITFMFMTRATLEVLGAVKGAFIAGPLGGVVGAYVSPIFGLLGQAAGRIGNRHLAQPSTWLKNRMAGNSVKVIKGSDGVEVADPSIGQLRNLYQQMGIDMEDQEVARVHAKLLNIYNASDTMYGKNLLPASQSGRNIVSDGAFWRPMNFASSMVSAAHAASNYEFHLYQYKKDLIEQSANKMSSQEAIDAMQAAVEEEMSTDNQETRGAAQVKVAEAKQRLIGFGAPAELTNLLASDSRELLVVKLQGATMAATFLYHEFQFPEYNRMLPDDMYKAYQTLRRGYGMDFFVREQAKAIKGVLESMDFAIKIDADLETPVATKKVTKQASKEQTKASAEDTGKRPILDSAQSKPKTGGRKLLKALGQDSAVVQVAERTGTLTNKKLVESEADRAAEALKEAGKR